MEIYTNYRLTFKSMDGRNTFTYPACATSEKAALRKVRESFGPEFRVYLSKIEVV